MSGECATCSWPYRETVGLVCQTCGTDYGATEPLAGGHAPDVSCADVGSEREAPTVPPARHTHEIVRVELPRYWCSCGAWLWNDREDLDLHRGPWDKKAVAAIIASMTVRFETADESECDHEWLDRPESDTRECLVCGREG